MTKRKFKIPFRMVLSVLTLLLVGVVIWQNAPEIGETFECLTNLRSSGGTCESMGYHGDANPPLWVLILLIPEQLFMYYACGQIFFSYLKGRRAVHRFNRKQILRISTELNFVTRAIPAGGVGGLAYMTYRLRPYNVTAGQASFLYVFRYAMTTVVNYLQALVAIAVLLIASQIPTEAEWVIALALLMNFGVFVGLWLIVYVTGSQRRIDWFAGFVTRLANCTVKFVTFGKVQKVLSGEKVRKYFMDIHESVRQVRKNKRELIKPTIWGVVYSMCEIGTYWLVAIALGQPGLLPYIMVGEAIGSVFDGIIPFGMYELSMMGVMMVLLGPDMEGLVVIVTVMARVFSLLFTIASGAVPYYRALGKERHGK